MISFCAAVKRCRRRADLFLFIFILTTVFSGYGHAGDNPDTKEDGFGAVLDRMNVERQKEYMNSLRTLNAELKNAYAALAKNYTGYRINYERTKRDIENRRSTPNYVLKNMQNLEAAKDKIENDIKKLEKDKKELREKVFSSYGTELPEPMKAEWNGEEKEYTDYLNSVYRQVGWWMQIEYSPQWKDDASQFWDYIRRYYQDHPRELDILK